MIEWGMMSWQAVTIAITIMGTIITLIVRAEKLMEYYKKYDAMKRKRFALKQQPHCQEVCPAPSAIVEVSTALTHLTEQMARNTKLTIDLSADRLMQKANHYIDKGYMPRVEKDTLLHMFLNYHFAKGNGPTMSIVDNALKLPYTPGGEYCDIDLSYIIQIESERRNNHD